MKKSLSIPAEIKLELTLVSTKRGYPLAAEILARGNSKELVIESVIEAQQLIDVARAAMLEASLKYPFWNVDSDRYNESHEAAFQDVQMGLFEKVVRYVGEQYPMCDSSTHKSH